MMRILALFQRNLIKQPAVIEATEVIEVLEAIVKIQVIREET